MKKRYYFYLIYLIVTSLVVTTVSFSRYSTTVEGVSQVTVARPVLSYVPQSLTYNGNPVLDFSEGISLSDIMPGDVLVYEFDVQNYDGSSQNEVLLKYLITVIFDPEEPTLPLSYTLLPEDTYQSAGGDWVYLGFGSQITHSYVLTVTWDEEEDDPMYTNQEQDIMIQIDSEQADSLI